MTTTLEPSTAEELVELLRLECARLRAERDHLQAVVWQLAGRLFDLTGDPEMHRLAQRPGEVSQGRATP